jgi:hypothetical protein
MTIRDFRRIALGMPGASESAHMAHPDFRVNGKIFATLGYPDNGWGMVKLTAEQQREFVLGAPDAFIPVKGAWGAKGATSVRLDKVDKESLGAAMTAACRNVPAKPPARTKSKARVR